jgi:hypothetical protein
LALQVLEGNEVGGVSVEMRKMGPEAQA